MAEMFPPYIPRAEEQVISGEVKLVRPDAPSRAVLLYGDGGVGKTKMLRELAATSRKNDLHVKWLGPIDIDDSEYWLLSNLEQRIINGLDPDKVHFGPYLRYLRRLPGQTLSDLDPEAVVSHLGTVKQEFISCYTKLVEETHQTIVIVFDTVEVVRGLSLLYTLAEWMKSLPATLFILSGRPMGNGAEADSIRRELEEGPDGLHVTPITLGEFTWEAAYEYLGKGKASDALSDDEKSKLVLLTRAYPLWLALTINYLVERGVPKEANSRSLADLEGNMPYGRPLTKSGTGWFRNYKQQLLTPYRDTDFQHEEINRLAVVRQNISQEVWEQLMADRVQPEGITSMAQKWEELLRVPWIRVRSNNQYVTLHDAVAEEISQRILQANDPDQTWRRERWRQAARIYADLSKEFETSLSREQERLKDASSRLTLEERSEVNTGENKESVFIAEVARLDVRKSELDELQTISLHYELLTDFDNGAKKFLTLFAKALAEKGPLPAERLAVEIQVFLPGSGTPPPKDAVGKVIHDFQEWLTGAGAEVHAQIVKSLADYQIKNEQPQAANVTIGKLAEQTTDPAMRFELNLLKGNALMRIPGESENAERYFSNALAEAEAMTSDNAVLLQAKALKEFGFYHRHRGRWHQANESYSEAFNLISAELIKGNTDEYRKEFASIERNWAYVNGISGRLGEATNLIESAIAIYHQFGMETDEAAARCVKGEILRYGWQFTLAWRSLEDARRMFEQRNNRAWLGTVFQEQAICLLQAHLKRIDFMPGYDMKQEARRLINLSLTICREQNLRAYPAALNRAARIFGEDDIDVGLDYAKQGIEWSQRLSDGWKQTACLVEYVELSYRGWAETGSERYRQGIRNIAAQVEEATADSDFVDLYGKWNLLQGHLKIRDWMHSHDTALLDGAAENYKTGFALVAETFVGSSSAFTIGMEFERFSSLFRGLPQEVRARWLGEFRRAWSPPETASTALLARLEELY